MMLKKGILFMTTIFPPGWYCSENIIEAPDFADHNRVQVYLCNR